MSTKKIDLEPCPFCGSQGVDITIYGEIGYCRCRKCEAEGPVVSTPAANPDEKAVAYAWNVRLGGRR